MKKLNNFLLILLPAILFFSYFPVISLGETDTMHLELSLPEIWLVIFFFTNLGNLKNLIRTFTPKKLAIVALFPLYATLSIFWSKNPLRAVLTAGLIWLIAFAIINIVYYLKTAGPDLKSKILRVFLVSTAIVCAFCWLQCILDLAGLPRSETLLCAGCTYSAFGFPHPNGFAIEPQFMGNLLLAPTLTTFYLLLIQKSKHRTRLTLLAALFSSTLFLTFSRGAIYAFLIGIVILILLTVVGAERTEIPRKHRLGDALLTFLTICATLVLTLTMQGIFSQLSPTSDTFSSGVAKSLHQLTLGRLDLRDQNREESAENNPESKDSEDAETSETISAFDGYVAESTSRRLDLTDYALDIWNDSPTNIIFGTGLGSAGVAMAEKYGFDSAKEIVQNQYASLLLELGLFAYVLIAYVVIRLAGHKFLRYAEATAEHKRVAPMTMGRDDAPRKFIACLITAYAITLCFFAGLPNALHLYLLPAVLFFLI